MAGSASRRKRRRRRRCRARSSCVIFPRPVSSPLESEEGTMLKLYHYWSSVCSQKVRLCLAEKGLEFASQHINLFDFDHWSPEYVKLNPKGVVPTLVHDGRPIIESNVIIEYLEDAYPSVRLRPRDPY